MLLKFFSGLYAQVSDVFGSTHDALHTLGVQPDEYNLTLGSEMHALICADATVYSEQACAHLELGLIDDLPDFMHDLYDRKAPERGTVQLSVVILEDEVAWRGLVGLCTVLVVGAKIGQSLDPNRMPRMGATLGSCDRPRAWALLHAQAQRR